MNSTNTIKFVSILAPSWRPFDIVDQNGNLTYVYNAVLIRILSGALRADYEIFTPADAQYGKKMPDGNWSGAIGMIKRSEGDIAISSVTLTEERNEAVKFIYPHLLSQVSFMTDKPQYLSKNLAIFHPFSHTMWITVGACLMTVALTFYLLKGRKVSFQRILIHTYGCLLQQSFDIGITRTSDRLLLLTWVWGVMIISYGYNAVLLSSLSFPGLTGIRDIPDLSKASAARSIKCSTVKGSYLPQQLLESDFESWREIGACIKRTEEEFKDQKFNFVEVKSKKAFIGATYGMALYERDYFISADSFYFDMYVFPYSDKFCCPESLSKVVFRLLEAGILDKIYRDELFFRIVEDKTADADLPQSIEKLIFDDVSGAFYILICGWLVALLSFIGEHCMKKYNESRN